MPVSENPRTVHVRCVQGRYPADPRRLDSDNIETTVQEIGRIVRVRLDDIDNPEFWMELVLEVEC